MSLPNLVKDVVTIYRTLETSKFSDEQKVKEIIKILSITAESAAIVTSTTKKIDRRSTTNKSSPMSPVPAPISPIKDVDPKGIDPPLPSSSSGEDDDFSSTDDQSSAVTSSPPHVVNNNAKVNIIKRKKTNDSSSAAVAAAPKTTWNQALEDFENSKVEYCMWGFAKEETVCGSMTSLVKNDPKKFVPLCNKCFDKKTKNPFLSKIPKDTKPITTKTKNVKNALPKEGAAVEGTEDKGAVAIKYFGIPPIKGVPILNSSGSADEENHAVKTPVPFSESEEMAPSEKEENECKKFFFVKSEVEDNVIFLCSINVANFENTKICMGLLRDYKHKDCACNGGASGNACEDVLNNVFELSPSDEALIKELESNSITMYQHGGEGEVMGIV